MNYIEKISLLLDKKDKKRLSWLVLFSIFISVIETIGISAIMPFIDIATNFDNIHSNKYYQWAFGFFDFHREIDFVITFGWTLLCFYLLRGGINLIFTFSMVSFTENLYARITNKLFKTYSAMPYQIFAIKNSSYLTKTIVTEVTLFSKVISSVLLMISEVFVVIFLYAVMLIVSWKITLTFTIILFLKLLFLTQIIFKKSESVGKIREKTEAQYYEIINKFFGNFKQSKLQDNSIIEATKNEFSKVVHKYTSANVIGSFLSAFPRLFIETIGFSLVILLIITFLFLNQSDASYILPVLSLFAIALYRILPSINRIVQGYNTLLFYHRSIDVIDQELKTRKEDLGDKVLEFKDKIELKNVNFSYQDKEVLHDINLTIRKGEKVAFIGESGSGKSTLVDLIIGLNRFNQGEMRIDNILVGKSNLQSWRSQVGYIPQQVYLFDGTVAENVCFGRVLDKKQLEYILKQVQMFDFLQTKNGINTFVGENGIQLSGGQKQRIAIARAIYGEPEVLVLDEATSALDEETESGIMKEIYQISQDKTLIIIAHRLTTIKDCDKVYQIKDGVIDV